jgi:TolB-like protein/Tfp pilus assembly protein PilF
MAIWTAEKKELEKLYESLKGQFPDLEKELVQLIRTEDANVVMLYSRRCLEVIITDLCECELNRPRKTEPLKGIIDKLQKEEKVPSHIISSMHGLNELSTYGAHPKDFDPEQVKPVLNNLNIIIKWYLKYKDFQIVDKQMLGEERHETKHSETSALEKSIAVLPFVNMSPEKDQDYFCDGITEEIINALAHIENLKVIARTSAFAFKDKQADIREIGRMLNVETLLEGSIRKADNRLRITAQLIKVADGSHIWSERYDREMKDVFAIQDEISMAIADNLKVKLLGERKATIVKQRTESLEAYNLYLKGIYYSRMFTFDGFNRASEYYEKALEIDPDYALAYVGLAEVLGFRTFWGNLKPGEGFPKAIEYLNKALSINSTLAEAYSALGTLNAFYYWNSKEADRNYRYALQINPNSSMIYMDYACFLSLAGRNEEAINMAERAKVYDPLSWYINSRTGDVYYYAGQYDRAIEEYRMTLTINPNYFITHFSLGLSYVEKGKVREVIAEFKKAVDLSNGNPFVMASLIVAYYRIWRKRKANKLFEELKKRSQSEYVPSTCFFVVYNNKGEEEKATEWLKRACTEHDTLLPYIRIGLLRNPARSKYIKLLKEMGMDY